MMLLDLDVDPPQARRWASVFPLRQTEAANQMPDGPPVGGVGWGCAFLVWELLLGLSMGQRIAAYIAACRVRAEFFTMSEQAELKTLESLTAADVMTPAPRTCSEFSTVLEAVMIFRDADCGAVPILSKGKPVAILTDRDVALASAEFPDLVDRPVSEILKPGVVSVDPGDSLGEVCDTLRRQGIRRVLVVGAASEVQGIIGWADVATVLSDRMMGQVVKDVVTAG
jgi:CBS domain-containing protein